MIAFFCWKFKCKFSFVVGKICRKTFDNRIFCIYFIVETVFRKREFAEMWRSVKRKVLFPDVSARGAFYALTQLLCGCYLLGSLAILMFGFCGVSLENPLRYGGDASLRNWLGYLDGGGRFVLAGWAGILLAFVIFYVWTTLAFFRKFAPRAPLSPFGCWVIWIVLSLFLWRIGVPAWVAVWIFLAFFPAVLPLFHSADRWKSALGAALSWCVGSALVLIPLYYYDAMLFRGGYGFHGSGEAVSGIFGISGFGWMFWQAAALFFLAVWYILTALFFARRNGVHLRALFGLGVAFWWGVSGAVFLLFCILTAVAGREVSREIAALERRFGRQVTVEAQAETCCDSETPDPVWQERWRQLCDAASPFHPGDDEENEGWAELNIVPDCVMMSEADLVLWRERFNRHAPALAEWEALLAGPIPPEARLTRRGGWFHGTGSGVEQDCRLFFKLQLWRLYFSLVDENREEALAAYRSLRLTEKFLQRELQTGAFFPVDLVELRLTGFRMLLASGILTDGELKCLATEMEEMELALESQLERFRYSQAVCALEFCDLFADGNFSAYGSNPFPLNATRFLLPQLRWYGLREKADLARLLLNPESQSPPLFLSGAIAPDDRILSHSLRKLQAHCRALRVMLRVELSRRRYGSLPETLPHLPPDPYGSGTMEYKFGMFPCRHRVFSRRRLTGLSGVPPNTFRWESREAFKPLPAIQVRCPGAGDDPWEEVSFTLPIRE